MHRLAGTPYHTSPACFKQFQRKIYRLLQRCWARETLQAQTTLASLVRSCQSLARDAHRSAGCRYDVNVTPDKRKVFIQDETQLLTALQQVNLGTPVMYTIDLISKAKPLESNSPFTLLCLLKSAAMGSMDPLKIPRALLMPQSAATSRRKPLNERALTSGGALS